jgi:hypothetical protein
MFLLACNSNQASAGSTTTPASAAAQPVARPTPAAPATPAAPSPEPVSAGDAVITSAKDQPKRSAEDVVRVAAAEKALLNAIAIAKQAKTLKEACGGVAALMDAVDELHKVKPPKGFEREFGEARNGIAMEVDNVKSTQCPDDNAADAESIREFLGKNVRDTFAKLQRIGNKK